MAHPRTLPVVIGSGDLSSDRSCALESTPVLRSRLHTLDREFSCPENGGGIQSHSSTGEIISDTLWNISMESVGEHGFCVKTKLHLLDRANQLRLGRKPDRDPKFKTFELIQKYTPIAFYTRSKVQQQDTARLFANDAPYQFQFAMETKEQFMKLIMQADEHHVEMSSKINTICDQQTLFSEQQDSTILELRFEIAALLTQLESKVTVAAIDDQLVKPKLESKQTGKLQHLSLKKPESNSSSTSTLEVAMIQNKYNQYKSKGQRNLLISTSNHILVC
jgi:hypothetical protein